MSNKEMFIEIKQKVIEWVKLNIDSLIKKGIKVEELINNEDCYRIEMDFEKCLIEIIVNQPEFAPYRFVAIQVLSMIENINEPIYVWYDDESNDISDIINQLNKGIELAFNYLHM